MAVIRVCCVAHQEKANSYLRRLITKADAPNQTPSVYSINMRLYLHRISQGDSHSQRQPLWHGHHQHGHANDEELDKILDVDGGAFR